MRWGGGKGVEWNWELGWVEEQAAGVERSVFCDSRALYLQPRVRLEVRKLSALGILEREGWSLMFIDRHTGTLLTANYDLNYSSKVFLPSYRAAIWACLAIPDCAMTMSAVVDDDNNKQRQPQKQHQQHHRHHQHRPLAPTKNSTNDTIIITNTHTNAINTTTKNTNTNTIQHRQQHQQPTQPPNTATNTNTNTNTSKHPSNTTTPATPPGPPPRSRHGCNCNRTGTNKQRRAPNSHKNMKPEERSAPPSGRQTLTKLYFLHCMHNNTT